MAHTVPPPLHDVRRFSRNAVVRGYFEAITETMLQLYMLCKPTCMTVTGYSCMAKFHISIVPLRSCNNYLGRLRNYHEDPLRPRDSNIPLHFAKMFFRGSSWQLYVNVWPWHKPAPSHSHRTTGYLCSFPITWISYLGKRIYPLSRVFVTIGDYQKTPPFPGFLGKSARDSGPNIHVPTFPEKMRMRMRSPQAF